jgi:hypothetical protein
MTTKCEPHVWLEVSPKFRVEYCFLCWLWRTNGTDEQHADRLRYMTLEGLVAEARKVRAEIVRLQWFEQRLTRRIRKYSAQLEKARV